VVIALSLYRDDRPPCPGTAEQIFGSVPAYP
jgi:hypothetical protein